MSKTLTSSVKATLAWTFTNPDAILGDTSNSNSFSYSQSFMSGTAINQCDLMYVTQGTLAASGTMNVDLAGSVVDFFGATITFARIKAMFVWLTTDTTATSINVGGSASNGLVGWISSAGTFGTDQPKLSVRNGGVFVLCAPDATGYPVTAATADLLKFTNADGANTATYKIGFLGASA